MYRFFLAVALFGRLILAATDWRECTAGNWRRCFGWDPRCVERNWMPGMPTDLLGEYPTLMDEECFRLPVKGLDGKRIKIFATADWIQRVFIDANIETTWLKIEDMLSRAYTATFAAFEGLHFDLPDVELLLTTSTAKHAFMQTNIHTIDRRCITFAGHIFNDFLFKADERAAQSYAHELYHCVQYKVRFDTRRDWVSDGTTEYFSNIAFPDVNHEWRHEENLDFALEGPLRSPYMALTPVYSQPNRYALSLFFQALESFRGGPQTIHEFMLKSPRLSEQASFAPLAERARLSADPDFSDMFNHFARQYSLVEPPAGSNQAILQSRIKDSCAYSPAGCTHGTYRRVQNLPGLQPKPVGTGTPKGADQVNYVLSFQPFTVAQFKLPVKAGSSITLSATTNGPKQHIAYRLANELEWKDLPATFKIPCGKAGVAVPDVLFLATSAADNDLDEIIITVTQKKTNKRQDEGGETCDDPEQPPVPPATGDCRPPGDVASSCLVGKTWSADIAMLQSEMDRLLASVSGLFPAGGTGSLKVVGKYMLDIKPDGSVVQTFEDFGFSIAVVASAGGVTIRAETLSTTKGRTTGWASTMTDPGGDGGMGSMCLAMTAADGTVTVALDGKVIETKPLALADATGYLQYFTSGMNYRCEGNKVTFGGPVASPNGPILSSLVFYQV